MLAGIGDLPDTILDRAVPSPMKPRAPHEHIEPFRERLVRPDARPLRDRLAAWTEPNLERLRAAWPEMPLGITDRAADLWEPLIALGDLAGGDWPELARRAASLMNSARVEARSEPRCPALADCRRAFDHRSIDRLTTGDSFGASNALTRHRGATCVGSHSTRAGSRTCSGAIEVHPGTHRFGHSTKRGYLREDFHDAWIRYLSDPDVSDVSVVSDIQQGREAAEADGKPPLPSAEEAKHAIQVKQNEPYLGTPTENERGHYQGRWSSHPPGARLVPTTPEDLAALKAIPTGAIGHVEVGHPRDDPDALFNADLYRKENE